MLAMIVALGGVMAVCGAGVETGHVYYAYRLLVSSTNAATLAGAEMMSAALTEASITTSTEYTNAVDTQVQKYSSVAGSYNASSFLHNDQITTTSLSCSTILENSPFYVACVTPPGGAGGYNAITVTQTADVPLWFGGLLGMPTMHIAAKSEASSKGGQNIPYNLAIIMDTTASMGDTVKGNKNCTGSQISCAVNGFLTMLENMDPCASGSTCSASSPYVDDVALYVFPAISTAYSANNYKADYCSSGKTGGATSVPYNFVNVTPGTSQNLFMESPTSTPNTNSGSYLLIPFNDVYKTSNGTQTLSASSALAMAVGSSGTGCAGLSAPGGQGTYYAQVIQQAQADLVTQQGSNAGSKNVLIILTDGDATASASGGQIVADNTCSSKTAGSCLNGTGTSSSNPAGSVSGVCYGYNCPAYPSAVGECGQAVWAAQQATTAGTLVYTIGFGSESSGCATDSTYTLTGLTNGAESWPSGSYSRTPCNAIAAMASNSSTYFSDNTSACSALDPANANFTSIAQIFQAIVTDLSTPRLFPPGT
jgi:hypothetical protein